MVSATVLSIAAAPVYATLSAHAPSGAIFTTLVDGSEVNFNIYQAKEDVYVDGGPGPGAPSMPRDLTTACRCSR